MSKESTDLYAIPEPETNFFSSPFTYIGNMFHSAADTVGDGIENIINNIGEELEDIRHGFHELDSSRKMQRKFVKPLNSDSVVDMLWDTPKSQHPELIQAARSKVNFELMWSNWSGWSDCQTKYGESTRSRECRGLFQQSKRTVQTCPGLSQQSRDCSEIYCKTVDCSKGYFQIQSKSHQPRSVSICNSNRYFIRCDQ